MSSTTTPVTSPALARRFVPATFDPSDPDQVRAQYEALLARPVGSPEALEEYLEAASELSAVVDEAGRRRYIAKTCATDDPEVERRFLEFVDRVEPVVKPLSFRVQKRFLESPHREALTARDRRYAMLERTWRADVELFREANVPLQTEVTRTAAEYDKVCGAQTVSYEGKEYTPAQASRFLEQPDRGVRRAVWEALTARRLADREALDGLFDRLLGLRARIAANAGRSDYRAYVWTLNKRFDYAPEDCLRFADAIERVCVPLMREMDRQRRADLGADELRPWDLGVDPKNRPALRPFDESQVDAFVDKTKAIFARLSDELAADFETLRVNGNLDLASRKGKAPGGYQETLEEVRQPFVFMNAAGMQRDVETLLHEGGHAFHSLAARHEPLMALRSAPIEFCEVASMSMELLGSEHFDVFYEDPADAARARRTMLEGIVAFFPWMATIDLFQHWLYTHPGHSRQERTEHWLSLMDRFGRGVSWDGYEAAKEARWQSQLHLFHYPFYYVEYGIAQLGALQLWMKSKEDPRRALAAYRSALALGGTRPLPELFAAAGIVFDFSEKTIRPLMEAVAEELATLPK